MTEYRNLVRAFCSASGKPLFAVTDGKGGVVDVTNGGDHEVPPPDYVIPRTGGRYLPLFDWAEPFDPKTHCREVSEYLIGDDRVVRLFDIIMLPAALYAAPRRYVVAGA